MIRGCGVNDVAVSEAEVAGPLQEVVRAPTVNPPADTRECAEILRRVCEAEDIPASIHSRTEERANLVARLAGDRSGPALLLNGHIDTVPPGDGWNVDPFGGLLRDGMIWGRGTCDMKSGVVALLMAMVSWRRSGRGFAGEIILQAVADEETGSRDGSLYLLEQGIGNTARAAICAEPTSLRVERGNRGLRWINIDVAGEASHAGRPHLGRNAVEAASRMIAALAASGTGRHNEAFEITTSSLSITTIEGGSTVNVIPDHCRFSIDRRMLPGETEAGVLDEIWVAIDPVVADMPGIAVEINLRSGGWDPYLLPEDEPIVQLALDAGRDVLGRAPTLGAKAACTDASHLVTRAGIPTVLLGPGNERLSHKPDERVAVADLVTGVEIYVAMFERFFNA